MKLNPETIEQIRIVEWIKQTTNLPVIHIANEGKRSQAMGAILKRMGMVAGASDLFIPRANAEYHGLFIEVKVGKGKLSPAQTMFIDKMLSEGYMALAVWGADAAIEFIRTFYQLSDIALRPRTPSLDATDASSLVQMTSLDPRHHTI